MTFCPSNRAFTSKVDTRWTSRRPPLLTSLQEALSRCVTRILVGLQELYTVEEDSQLYIAFEDPRFTAGGLNSGNYNLFPEKSGVSPEEHASYVADAAVYMLGNLLRSYATLTIDDRFKIKVHVLSASRSRARRLARGVYRPPNNPGPRY